MDDAIGEILIRLPPDDPASLVRASLVCQAWLGILSDRAFHRRYRAFHRKPELLAFLHNNRVAPFPRFVPTVAFRPHDPPDHARLRALDCRHGRALFVEALKPSRLVVWDPMTRDRWELNLSNPDLLFWCISGAVLCAAADCDHSDCRGGPFRVVLVSTTETVTRAWVYSSETGQWSAPASLPFQSYIRTEKPSLLIGGALYFLHNKGILRYDLRGHCLSWINLPKGPRGIVLMDTEDHRLGCAQLTRRSLHLWVWEAGPDGVAAWAQRRVIDLKMLFPILSDHRFNVDLVCFAERTDIVFVRIFKRTPAESDDESDESGGELEEESGKSEDESDESEEELEESGEELEGSGDELEESGKKLEGKSEESEEESVDESSEKSEEESSEESRKKSEDSNEESEEEESEDSNEESEEEEEEEEDSNEESEEEEESEEDSNEESKEEESADIGIFTIELKSKRVKMVYKGELFHSIFPYTIFLEHPCT